ncbi:small conductance calcium-activated potassium channel protein 2-like isoform X2 [Mya arenaria]|nr:small conductance calcium-activated potassium channel protein 2-like isoform X2 [Mya arenaria]XP_052798309.1 small conductance calcium-activated potassium channel protein 2-like isoform X2 [Mya arenaria]
MKTYGGIHLIEGDSNGKGNHYRTLGHRLDRRRKLIKARRIVIDVVCAVALLGIVLMMIETEFYIFRYTDKADAASVLFKISISISTVFLLLGICLDYYVDLKIKALDAGVRDWKTVFTNSTALCLFFELVVCSIHPFPGDMRFQYVSPYGQARKVSIDAILSILMMSRLYLIAKFAVVHSRLLTDSSTNSIGALSKIKINTIFVFKAAMTNNPAQLLVSVMLTTFIVNTWAMRTCESYYIGTVDPNSYMEIMWLIATTFLTVGYGDKIPQSYCGRYISICTGLMGVGTTALLVAVLARKLEQTRSERYVFNMVSRIQIEKRRKTAAANVIKSVIQLWMVRKYSSEDKALKRKYMDHLKASIRQLRTAKMEKAHIDEFNVGILEVSETVNRISDTFDKFERGEHKREESRNVSLENRLLGIEQKLDEIRTLLNVTR